MKKPQQQSSEVVRKSQVWRGNVQFTSSFYSSCCWNPLQLFIKYSPRRRCLSYWKRRSIYAGLWLQAANGTQLKSTQHSFQSTRCWLPSLVVFACYARRWWCLMVMEQLFNQSAEPDSSHEKEWIENIIITSNHWPLLVKPSNHQCRFDRRVSVEATTWKRPRAGLSGAATKNWRFHQLIYIGGNLVLLSRWFCKVDFLEWLPVTLWLSDLQLRLPIANIIRSILQLTPEERTKRRVSRQSMETLCLWGLFGRNCIHQVEEGSMW